MATILVVDDDPQLRQSFERLLKAEGHTVLTAPSGEKGVEIASESEPDMAVLDVRLPGMNGLETFKVLRGMYPSLPVLVMTAYGTTETAIEATKMGAFDYVMKPFNVPNVLSLIGRAVEVRAPRPVSSDSVATSDALLGRSVAMQEVCKQIGRAAPTQATVLIRGESGTGKELVAHAIHKHSNRSDHPFCVINCVAIPETLLESELFGYEKGAFTGASNRKAGKIEQANRGTVFLDEIGDMPPPIQAKILRLLQERQIERLGGKLPIPVDVRIIAATNRDLEKAVASGEFREDLYYRLNVVSLTLPPLRERREDIPLLGGHFVEKFAKELNMPNPGLTDRAKAALQDFPWPGNVRELGNMMQKALIFSRGLPIDAEDIAALLGGAVSTSGGLDENTEESVVRWVRHALLAEPGDGLFESLGDRFCAIVIREALTLTGGNRTRASKLLGMSRPTLIARIEKYGLKVEASVS
jgi:DNA-binding NtrC family response regulator